jgi:hypothetical protein
MAEQTNHGEETQDQKRDAVAERAFSYATGECGCSEKERFWCPLRKIEVVVREEKHSNKEQKRWRGESVKLGR